LAVLTDGLRRQMAVLAAQADKQRRHEAMLAKEADERRRHEAVLAAEAADEQCQHESAATVIERIQTEFALCAAPLDAVLAEIANMGGGTQPSFPLAVSPSALVPAAQPSHEVDGQLQTVRPRARPRRRTGRRNIPRAPSSFVDVAPTHPELLQGGIQRQLHPCWRERPHFVARWCRHLRPP